MSQRNDIPDAVRASQSKVSDPRVSAWVAANAGSGKTHVLAQRVINLLLSGVEPEKILCITFTKAAAANMAKRVFDTLGEWTTLNDEALEAAIRSRSTLAVDAKTLAHARRLFARALETPGGLKVQTIHAFCTQLLHQFPFEGNIAARFTVLDDAEQTQLLEELTLAILLKGAELPDSSLGRALAVAMTAGADQTFRDVIRGTIAQRDAILRWVGKAGSVEEAGIALSRDLDLDPDESRDAIEGEFFTGSLIEAGEWPAIAAALAQGSKSDVDQAQRFSRLSALPNTTRLNTYLDIFLTGERSPRRSIITKAIKEPGLIERLMAEQGRICALLERLRAVICRDRSLALLTVAHAVLRRYDEEKKYRGLADYDDLIDKTLELLTNVDAAWVHYKLDLGIDHLLIDEAQDTSSKQWQIVQRLIAEFTAGAGARGLRRTIFAVGDEKQSIFSFQNAAPREFVEIGRELARAHEASRQDFVFGKLEYSFRSGESLLTAVDAVFKDIASSVTSDQGGFPAHIALSDAAPGLVEIWEPLKPDERREIEGWDAPFDTISETSPRVQLARRIARMVRRTVDRSEPVSLDRHAARYGDFLILVRQRGELFEAIIRALKNEGVTVAGADRLVLTEHIAVMDLMALGDALLLPADDLALATVLRSPLFGFEDDDLFDIAWDRGSLSLRASLAAKADIRDIFAAADALLNELEQEAQHKTPFTFYAELLGPAGARRRFLARLGVEANDALDEFLNLALDYERRETQSLQGFLAWLRQARAEVKRDMEIARDEVRVMTVHGAKGLEAPVVVLADTMTEPAGPRPPRLLRLPDGAMIWAGRKADDVKQVADARQSAQLAAEDEYRRLLYVAMTRAEDRLIICGAEGVRKRPDRCWYDLIRSALDPALTEETDGEEKVLRYRKTAPAAAHRQNLGLTSGDVRAKPREFPSWLRRPARPQAQPAPTLSPSAALDEDIGRVVSAASSPTDRQKALERGRIVHRLMQSLPDIPPPRREDALEHYLANAAKNFSDVERTDIARQVFAVLDGEDFAQLFASGSRAEVPIVGRVTRADGAAMRVAGQVDRLIVTDNTVLIADYKTDSAPPRQHDDVPQPYIAQLGLYREVLSRIYPDKAVRAALIFSNAPMLIELSTAAMETAMSTALNETLPNH